MLYVTKYALTRGILEFDDHDLQCRLANNRVVVAGKVYTIGKSIFNGRQQALQDCEDRRSKEIAKLQALNFGARE